MTDISPEHFLWELDADGVAVVTLNRPERKNPLTFESYAELGETFRSLNDNKNVKAVVITGAGENFCSGGDVHEIIGPLTKMGMDDLLKFTRMTGALVLAIRNCPQPVLTAIDGICAGAGAAIAYGKRYALRHCARKNSVSFYPRRSRRSRHGRLRDSAANHRPGAGVGITLQRTLNERGRRRALGMVQCHFRSGTSCLRKQKPLLRGSPPARISLTALPKHN